MSYNVLIAWLISDQGAHLSVDAFLRIVIMQKSSARFMWYCAFFDQPDARPFQFRNKVGAMQIMRRGQADRAVAVWVRSPIRKPRACFFGLFPRELQPCGRYNQLITVLLAAQHNLCHVCKAARPAT